MKKTFQQTEYLQRYGFSMPARAVFKPKKGLSEDVVSQISFIKKEPAWMKEFRLKSLKIFKKKKLPQWGPDLKGIDFDNIYYYIKPVEKKLSSWKELPADIQETFEKLKIPDQERDFFAGVEAQYDSEVVYGSLKKEIEKQGVIFCDTDTALKKYPEIFKKYFAKIVPPGDNKFAALNSAFWSGGTFIWVPKGVEVKIPLQAYFRINSPNFGQFERTLIIAEKGSSVSYFEGCTAPVYKTDSLHAAVVEIIVKKGAKVQYTTIQNWSSNVYNLVTKRAFVEEQGTMLWHDFNIGSKITMKYPSIFLRGPKARGEILSLAYAKEGQYQDSGAKAVHLAPETSSKIISKSISAGGGRTSFRGQLQIAKGAKNSRAFVQCDALILDKKSRSDTYPTLLIGEKEVNVAHEAKISKISDEQIFYLNTRGIPKEKAASLIILGFYQPVSQTLPVEYSVELERLLNFDAKTATL